MSRKRVFPTLFVLVIAVIIAVLLPASAQETERPDIRMTTGLVRTHPSQGDVREVEGTHAALFSTEDGVTMSFRTNELEEGHVYTAWWVIINNPESCAASPCTPAEFLGSPESFATEVTFADGLLVSAEGRMEFAASLAAGEVPEAWYGNGLTNPLGAEIHIVINDHGPVITEMVGDMLNSLRAGCTDESVPAPYPDNAKADGAAGPNTCRLVQFTIFQQQ